MLNVFNPIPERGAEESDGATVPKFGQVEFQVVSKPGQAIYVEWPTSEPMENVLAAITCLERAGSGCWRVVFDPDDEGTWEMLVGGYRLHGMYADECTPMELI